MKKILSLILTLVLISAAFGLIGCNKKESSVSVKETTLTYEYVKDADGDYYAVKGLKISDADAEKMADGETVSFEVVVPAEYNNLPVKKINDGALKNQTIITKLSFAENSNIEEIGKGALSGCTSLEEISLPFIGQKVGAVNANKVFGYIFGEDSVDNATSITQTYNAGSSDNTTTVYIPDSLKKITLTGDEVSAYAFNGITTLTDIEFTGNITCIPAGAFAGCTALAQVNLPATVTEIGVGAFDSCTNLRYFDFTNITVIGSKAFNGCTKLGFANRAIVLPATITSVGRNAFSGCTSIYELEIGYATVEEFTFSGCTSLAVVNLTGNGVIKNGAFIGCTALGADDVQGLDNYTTNYSFDWELEGLS